MVDQGTKTRLAAAARRSHSPMRCVALEEENDQKDDQDQQQNATTDVHLNLLGRR
jgi:hypothetical protein